MDNLTKSWGFFVAEGVFFLILGLIALAMPWVMTLSVELLLGWLFLIGGVIQGFRTFQTKDAPGFILSLLSSILLIVAGVTMLANPFTGALTITLLLAFFFLIDGIFKFFYAFTAPAQRGWIILGSLIELALAWIIWQQWPVSGITFLGILVGVWMVYFGAVSLAFGLKMRHHRAV